MQQQVFNGFRPGDIIDQRYEIVSQIGQGGFGIVYRARQMAIDRHVALKVLLPEADTVDPMAVERFRREAVLISSLESPNTITLIEFGQTHGGVLYTVMEFAKGITLRDALAQEHKLTAERTVHIAKQVLNSLHEAHSRGIIHRDLKPANIMIGEYAGQKDHVKVLDFGIAKILKSGTDTQSTLALTGRIVGTPKYMSPEHIRGLTPTPSSDLYALGLIIYEMLTGEPAIKSNEPMEQVEAQLRKEDIALPPNLPSIPAALIAAVNRALKKDVAERFASAEALSQALDNAMAKQVVGGLAAAVTVQRQAVVPVSGSLSLPGKRVIGGPAPAAVTATAAGAEEKQGSSLGPYLIVATILFLLAAAGAVFMILRGRPTGPDTDPQGSDTSMVTPGETDLSQVEPPYGETDVGGLPGREPDAGQVPEETADLGTPGEVPDAAGSQVPPEGVRDAGTVPPVPSTDQPDTGGSTTDVIVPVVPVEPTAPPVVPVEPTVAAAVPMVDVEIVADPARSRVTVGGERICNSTPCTIRVPADGTPVSVRVSRADYQTARIEVRASDAPRREVRLQPEEREGEIAPIE